MNFQSMYQKQTHLRISQSNFGDCILSQKDFTGALIEITSIIEKETSDNIMIP